MRSRRMAGRIAACLIIIFAVPAALIASLFVLPTQYSETYLCALQDKWTALEAAEGKRIVIVGGSGAAFGVRCDLLEAEMEGYSVRNFGLYAGLGTTVMFELVRPLLREGDIVVFSPEQSGQTLSDFFSTESMWQAADGMPKLLSSLESGRYGRMIGRLPQFAGERARMFFDGDAPVGEGVYRRSVFNGYGDIEDQARDRNIMADGVDVNMNIVFDKTLPTEEFFEKVNKFTASCKRDGIKVFYSFCPMNAAAVAEREASRAGVYTEYLKGRLDCPVIGDASDAIMESGWFFDTNFHLNSAGAVVNTARLAAELKEALGDDSPVNIQLPEMPDAESAESILGDCSDADCFVYEDDGGALCIVRLTDAGMKKEKLTVPTAYGDKPVTGMLHTVFADNKNIKEIVLQKNISAIEDNSFSGCDSLEKLYIKNTRPENCTVGAGLLDGTKALIYVPAERLSVYKTNYFWAPHAARIRADGAGDDNPEGDDVNSDGRYVTYMANGGRGKNSWGDSVTLPGNNSHLRQNTAIGTRYFERDGYILTCWNTSPDGSGKNVGLGSRIERGENKVLYAQWEKTLEQDSFVFEYHGSEAWIVGYIGSEEVCAVPEKVDGAKVTRICTGAFAGAAIKRLVLPPSVRVIEESAFQGCTVKEVILFDSLESVHPDSFADCGTLQTLRVNAAVSPVYSGSYFDTFADKYDRLLSLTGKKKLILFSGSSGRYGYDSPALQTAFPEYEVVNMGVYAYTTALPQYDLILQLSGKGDVLLSAPEFDAVSDQFCTDDRLDAQFWAMMESNYDAAANLDLREYSDVFASFGEYLGARSGMAGKNYGISPARFDDDGNYYTFDTYNKYGDLILPRPNGNRDECLRHNIADYTVQSFPEGTTESLNGVYRRFTDKGINVYFTYTPRNHASLTEESTAKAIRQLDAYLRENISVPIISEIEDSLYSGIYFYLIDSHLSSEGAEIRTERVISDLGKWLGCEN